MTWQKQKCLYKFETKYRHIFSVSNYNSYLTFVDVISHGSFPCRRLHE